MNEQERDSLLANLRRNRERLLSAVKELASGQLTYRAADTTWSVADCVEHITTVEGFVVSRIQRVLEGAPQPEKRPSVAGKLEFMNENVPARETKFQGPEFSHPKRQWTEFPELIDGFNATRDRSIQFASDTRADLHDYFFPHPAFGDLDCYQWLVLVGLHCERHVRQMEEVMAHPACPARAAEA
jgi:uncharacterized damage-inducible protein DinB